MKITQTRCNYCAKETEDSYAEHGWILFDGKISISGGRKPDRTARTAYHSGDLDFCSNTCLANWMTQLEEKQLGPKRKPRARGGTR